MKPRRLILQLLATLVLLSAPPPAGAYVTEYPPTLGRMCAWSTHVMVVKVEKIKKEDRGGVIVYRKVRDIKGKWPADLIKHRIPTDGRIQVGPTKEDQQPLGADIM